MPALESLLTTAAAAGVLLVSLAAALYGAATITRRLLPQAPLGVRLVALGIGAAWMLLVLLLLLLFLQGLRPLVLLTGTLVLALACRLALGSPPAGATRLVLTLLRAAQRQPVGAAAVLVGTLLVVQLGRALLLPPLSWDSLTYHMTLPALWVQHGGYCQWPAPDAWVDYSRFPSNGELFTALALLPFHGDLLANLVNFPFLLLGAGAVHALARELGSTRRISLLAAACWALAPPAFTFVTTQYVDIQAAAETIAAWLFLVRYLRTRAAGDATLAGAAFGLAVGTKHLALVPAALGVGILLVLLAKDRCRGPARRSSCGFAIAAVLAGAAFYVRNWLETGNPVFPFEVRLGGTVVFAGSQFQGTATDFVPTGAGFLDKLVGFTPEFAPISFGPPTLLVATLALGSLLIALFGRHRRRWLVVALAVAAEVLVFGSERMRVLREVWGDVSQRLLLTSGALLLCAAAATSRWRHAAARRLAACLLLAALALEASAVNTAMGRVDFRLPITVASLVVAIAIAVILVLGAKRPQRTLWAVGGLGTVAAVTGLAFLQVHRDATRHGDYLDGWDAHQIPKATAAGWNAVDDPTRPVRIAFTAGWCLWGHHWFVYPLFGRRLQNQLLYVPTTASGAPGSYRPEAPVEPRTTAATWIARLQQARAEVLFVSMPPPPELEWVEANPQVFLLRTSAPGYRIYDLKW